MAVIYPVGLVVSAIWLVFTDLEDKGGLRFERGVRQRLGFDAGAPGVERVRPSLN